MAAEASTRALPWIATFLAIFIASPIAIGTKSEKPSAPVSASVEPASTAPTSPVSAYCAERLSVTLSEALLDATLAQAAPGDLSPVVATFAGEKKSIDVFIATIPDPIDSGYGYMFQSLLHSIQLGVEEELNGLQYFRTFAWLPWYDTKEATVKESEACREQTPGFVAFRSSKEGHYGLVLLVGETPTRGLVPLAMQQALAIVKAFRQQQTTPVLKILGPVFSGSAASLKQAVSTLDASWDVTIVSGTATGTGLRQQLSRTRPVGGAHGKIEFWTTTVPEAVMQCRYLAFLCHYINTEGRSNGKRVCTGERTGRGRHPGAVESVKLPQVALLHESGTQFGTSVVGGAGGPCRYEAGFNAEFPANVSTLRDAYESHDKDSGAKKNGTRVTSLEVSLREPRPPPGLASQPSPKGTFARDLALSRTIAALESQHVTHVGVQATEVADAIFISRKIRDVAPDIRVAVFQADSLLLHP